MGAEWEPWLSGYHVINYLLHNLDEGHRDTKGVVMVDGWPAKLDRWGFEGVDHFRQIIVAVLVPYVTTL